MRELLQVLQVQHLPQLHPHSAMARKDKSPIKAQFSARQLHGMGFAMRQLPELSPAPTKGLPP